MPVFYKRKELLVTAMNKLITGGYIRTGIEHFGLSEDPVVDILKKEQVTYSSLGTTTGDTNVILAIGRSSYRTIGDYYFQYPYEQESINQETCEGIFPIFRGHHLTKDDLVRREIKKIKNIFFISKSAIAHDLDLNFEENFSQEIIELKEFIKDDLNTNENDLIKLIENDKQFFNLIGSVLNKYCSNENSTEI